MSLSEKIASDLKAAMKSGQRTRVDVLRMLKAQIKNTEIEKGRELTEEEEIQVLQSAAKKRKEAMELYEKGGRPELAAKEKEELTIIETYLPKQMSRQEVEAVVSAIISEVGASSVKDFGKVMKAAMGQLRGKADGKVVQEIVRSKLG